MANHIPGMGDPAGPEDRQSETHPSVSAKQLFDRTFVSAAVVVSAAYAGIVVVIAWLVGKEAAGVAGVALTALATAIFTQFENLRFNQATESNVTTKIPTLSISYIALSALAFLGAQTFIAVVLGTIVLPLVETVTRRLDFRVDALTVALSFSAAVFFLAGFVGGRAAGKKHALTYTHVMLGHW